jgi:peroxiredoxin
MIHAYRIRAGLRNNTGTILLLSLLWLSPLPTLAGELTALPAASPPGFSLPDLAGRPRSLDDFAGKVVLVTFWASWCSPCIEEMPSIRRLSARMANRPFTVVGVNVGEPERRARAAAGRLGIEFPILLDRDSSVFEGWGADILPTAYVLGRSGRVRYIAHGPVDWEQDEIVDTLKQLATEQPLGGQ